MNTFKDNYELHILSKAINNCIDKFLPAEANKALYLILHQSDDLVWEISTSIFLISGHKVDFSLVRDLANARVESLKILGLEQLEAEIKRKVEEEATRIEEARLNAEQEAHRKAEEARRKAEEEEKLKQAGFNLEENENRFSLEVEVFYKLQGIIVDKLEVEADRVTLDSNVTEDLGADELDVTELIMAIEEEFEIELNQEFAPELKFSFWGSSEDRPGYVAHYSIRDLLNAVISEI
jgi:acyl carrier protein